MLMLGNSKKKKHPILAIAVGAFAVYGAYSMVCSAKECCLARMDKISCMLSKKKKDKCECEENTQSDS